MFLYDECQGECRNDHDHCQRAHAPPVDGEFGGVIQQTDRQRLGIGRPGELGCQREFVPGNQEGEDTGGGDARTRQRKFNLPEGLPPGAAVDLGRFRKIPGTWRKKPSISQTVKGTLSAT